MKRRLSRFVAATEGVRIPRPKHPFDDSGQTAQYAPTRIT